MWKVQRIDEMKIVNVRRTAGENDRVYTRYTCNTKEGEEDRLQLDGIRYRGQCHG